MLPACPPVAGGRREATRRFCRASGLIAHAGEAFTLTAFWTLVNDCGLTALRARHFRFQDRGFLEDRAASVALKECRSPSHRPKLNRCHNKVLPCPVEPVSCSTPADSTTAAKVKAGKTERNQCSDDGTLSLHRGCREFESLIAHHYINALAVSNKVRHGFSGTHPCASEEYEKSSAWRRGSYYRPMTLGDRSTAALSVTSTRPPLARCRRQP